MTSREVMMRTVEALAQMGVREPARVLKDAAQIHAAIMACDDGEDLAPRKTGKAA